MTRKQQNQQQNQMSGGEGAADWGLKAYGDANQQQAISATDNAIAVNPSACGPSIPMKGGARKELQELLNQKMQEMQQQQENSQNGGFMQQLSNLVAVFNKNKLSENDMNNALSMMSGGSGVLENIAVPAILLYLNQRIGKKSNQFKKQKSMKLRRSSRLSAKSRK